MAVTCNLRVETACRDPATPPDAFAEWDSPDTIAAVRDALSLRHEVRVVPATPDALEELRRAPPDLVFNLAEGQGGPQRESLVPAVLEYWGIPYTGSGPLSLGICLDKGLARDLLGAHGLPVPPGLVCEAPPRADPPFGYPAIVKPLHEGSSMGIRDDSVVTSLPALRDRVQRVRRLYRQGALVERFLPGREFTVALLGNGDDLEVLPIVEIRHDALPPGAQPLYGYEAKWVWDVPERPLKIFECPARIDPALADRIAELSRDAFRVTGCRDWCRIDIRLDESGVPHLLELNPLPGILPRAEQNSCFPKAARAAGMTYDDLLLKVVEIAARRLGIPAREVAPAAV